MRSVRWVKVWRDIWLHKARTALVVAAIAVGITGAGAVLNTWALVRRATREGYLATNPASATLTFDAVDSAVLARVRALPSVRAAEARRTLIASVMADGTWRTAILFVASDMAKSGIGTVVGERGSWPPADGALTVEKSSVEFANLSVGDSVSVRLGTGDAIILPVTGVARDAGLAPGWMEHVVYGFVTPATAARLGVPLAPNQLQIVVRDGALDREAVRRVGYEVKAAAEAADRKVLALDVPGPGEHIHAAQMDSLLLTQGAFGALALLLSAFLVVNLIGAMLVGQVREIGIMKAVGAGSGQVARMYLGLALVMGLAACVVAIPLAALLGRGYAGFTADLLNFDVRPYDIPIGSFVAQLLVGALLPVVAAAIPVVRGCRVSVADALRDIGISVAAFVGHRPVLGSVNGVARPLLLSLRNAFRRRVRMALTLATLALGGAVFIGSLGLRTSIRRSVGNQFGEVLRYDMAVRFSTTHAPDSLERMVRAIGGVKGAEAWSGVRAAVAHEGNMVGNSFVITGLATDARLVAFPMVSGRWILPGDAAAIVVTRRLLAEEPSLILGADLPLVIGGRTTTWRIVGVVDAGPQTGAYATREAVALVTGTGRAGVVVVSAARRETAAQSELLQRMRDQLEGSGFPVESTQLMAASRSAMEDHLLLVAGFLVAMSQLTIIVGGLGLASTMSLSVLERTREIGVLRAIGASHSAIVTMVQVEGLVVAALSWLIALPLSLPMSVLVGRAFGRVMITVPVTWVPEASAILIWLGISVGVSLAACAWPARHATRITTAAALAYE